jgi:hypothetical protein
MVVKRVDPMSFAKITGVLYALLGLCFGAIFSLIGLAGAAVSNTLGRSGAGLFFGIGAVIILPIFYGVIGFVFSLIGAALYNVVAGWVGGVEMEME